MKTPLNTSLINSVNTLLLHYKLIENNLESEYSNDEVIFAQKSIAEFFKNIHPYIDEVTRQKQSSLKGLKPEWRKFIRSFAQAKRNRLKYKSTLFRDLNIDFESIIINGDKEVLSDLINSLNELRLFINEEQLSKVNIFYR